jgi:predicted RNA-binding Zn-ribbon protein involved in translation (DUF1610 family)
MKRRCPGMDPAYFRPEDIRMQKCIRCNADLEFWKDDIFLTCPGCGTRNTNARIDMTCLSWCREAASCLGSDDIDEWIRKHGNNKSTEGT